MTRREAEAPRPSRLDGTGKRRRGFGLESPLPADRRIVLRAVLRHVASERPALVPIGLAVDKPDAATSTPGLPDLLLLAPGGRSVFVRIKTQAEALTRAHKAFADLCRGCGIPLVVVRSLPEARRAFDALRL